MKLIDSMESVVRSYCRNFPVVFKTASGSIIYDENSNAYIDFFLSAGSLNYGHNEKLLKSEIIRYIESDGVMNSLDFATSSKIDFINCFNDAILKPRRMSYKMQFTGPTGTNAIEAAIKLARKVKKRANVVAFTGAYHGLTAGSLSITANRFYRNEAYVNRQNVSFLPFDQYFGPDIDTSQMLRKYLEDSSSGVDLPCAIILETTQAEGGINVASDEWLTNIKALCTEYDVLLIVDDIQVGCGRCGTFFSFESSGVSPHIVALSKSLSGFGLPFSMLLIDPDLDQWQPGEHSGTFRGNNLAFVGGAKILQRWKDPEFVKGIADIGDKLLSYVSTWAEKYPSLVKEVRGKGLIYGIEMLNSDYANNVVKMAFESGLITEICGRGGCVIKIMPALNVPQDVLDKGLGILEFCINKYHTSRKGTWSGLK